ncbi:MAG: hypothetical protein AAGG02_08375, partial [Cyanobacteria bacterium P01_H01_bin.15]
VERLHRRMVWRRWQITLFCWLTFGVYGLWSMRSEISLLRDHFTWAAVRYAIYYNRPAAVCVSFCLGLTTALLVWQSRNILFGLPGIERQRLAQKAQKICHQGPRHPLWNEVCK